MKTLSIRQPWAQLVVSGKKDIENRSRRTHYRGRFLVHAPMKFDDRGIPQCLTPPQVLNIPDLDDWINEGFLLRAIIGSVEIIDCVRDHPSVWAEPDVWNWVLANPVMFDEPICGIPGKLGFWEYNITPDWKAKSDEERMEDSVKFSSEIIEKALEESP